MKQFLLRILRFFAFYFTFGAFIFYVAVNLASMPPTMHLVRRYIVMPFNPIARAVHLEELSSSAHRALLVRSAIKLDIFQELGRMQKCVPLSQLALHAGKVMMDQRQKDRQIHKRRKSNKKSGIIKNRPLTVDAMQDLLEALSAMGLIESCTPSAETVDSTSSHEMLLLMRHGYKMTVLADKHLYVKEAGNSEDDWSGMILAANTPEVISSLLHWGDPSPTKVETPSSTALISDADGDDAVAEDEGLRQQMLGGSLSISREAEGRLWQQFAAGTRDPFSRVARAVTRRIDEIVATHPVADEMNNNNHQCTSLYIDVGCGSGVFAEQHCRFSGNSSSSRWSYVLVDLPEVVDFLKENRNPSSVCPLGNSVSFVPANATDGPAFQASIRGAVRQHFDAAEKEKKRLCRVVFVMNSFLQHFSDEAVMDILVRTLRTTMSLVQKKKQDRFQIVLSVTELELPAESFNPWKEMLPVGRIFAPVLRSFANYGSVRLEGAYSHLLSQAVSVVAVGEKWSCGAPTEKRMWPMPATNTALVCEFV